MTVIMESAILKQAVMNLRKTISASLKCSWEFLTLIYVFSLSLNCDFVGSQLRNQCRHHLNLLWNDALFSNFVDSFYFIVLYKNQIVILNSAIRQNALNAVKFDPI